MSYAIGMLCGIVFMRVFHRVFLRSCCERHFRQHVKEPCQHWGCRAMGVNHYGYCNLHAKEGGR